MKYAKARRFEKYLLSQSAAELRTEERSETMHCLSFAQDKDIVQHENMLSPLLHHNLKFIIYNMQNYVTRVINLSKF